MILLIFFLDYDLTNKITYQSVNSLPYKYSVVNLICDLLKLFSPTSKI